jgi:hypothetical protein
MKKPENAPLQIGVHAKKQILENIKNLESTVYALVAAIECRIYRDARDYETMEADDMFHGTDLIQPDDKALLRILAEAFNNEVVFFRNDIDKMQEFRELI